METDCDVLEDVDTLLLEGLTDGNMVILYDDNVNDIDSVINILIDVCNMDNETAVQKTFEAHVRGNAEVYRDDDEEKCKKVYHALKRKGLTVELV